MVTQYSYLHTIDVWICMQHAHNTHRDVSAFHLHFTTIKYNILVSTASRNCRHLPSKFTAITNCEQNYWKWLHFKNRNLLMLQQVCTCMSIVVLWVLTPDKNMHRFTNIDVSTLGLTPRKRKIVDVIHIKCQSLYSTGYSTYERIPRTTTV